MGDMTTPAARTRLVWKTAEIKRTVASLVTFGLIGTAIAASSWVAMVLMVGFAKSLGL